MILSTGQVQQLWAEMEMTTTALAAVGELSQLFLELHNLRWREINIPSSLTEGRRENNGNTFQVPYYRQAQSRSDRKFISNLLALVGFCDLFCFLVRHIASFQTGLFWLFVPVSQEKKKKNLIKNMIFSPFSFFKAAEMRWTNSN